MSFLGLSGTGGAIAGGVGSVIAGGTLALVSVTGLISSQTAAPDRSPTDVSKPAVVDYGTTAG